VEVHRSFECQEILDDRITKEELRENLAKEEEVL